MRRAIAKRASFDAIHQPTVLKVDFFVLGDAPRSSKGAVSLPHSRDPIGVSSYRARKTWSFASSTGTGRGVASQTASGATCWAYSRSRPNDSISRTSATGRKRSDSPNCSSGR